MSTILETLTVRYLLNGEQPGDSYILFDYEQFSECSDIDLWHDLYLLFGVKESVLVQFKGNAPSKILLPLLWKNNEEQLVYRIGNTSIPLVVNEKGLTIGGKIKLDYDTAKINDKEYVSFSYLVKLQGKKPYDMNVQILFYDPEFNPTEISRQVKSAMRLGDFDEVISLLLPVVKEIPIFASTASLPHYFQHIFANGLFKEYQNRLGGTMAVVIRNPFYYVDKTFQKVVVQAEIDSYDFAKRLGTSYDVESWKKMKPLEEIEAITFSESTTKNHDYLKSIAFNGRKSSWAVMVVTGPNKSRHDWPPSVSFIPDYLIKQNPGIMETVKSFFPKDYVFPPFIDEQQSLPSEQSSNLLTAKNDSKFLKAAEDFSFSDKTDKKEDKSTTRVQKKTSNKVDGAIRVTAEVVSLDEALAEHYGLDDIPF